MKILITSGATREPIDEVRYLSNLSTGTTGAALADALAIRGHAITLLAGTGAVRPAAVSQTATFSSTADLQAQLRRRVASGGYDAVIHCAAVADYALAHIARGKLSSRRRSLTLRLVPTPKLLSQIKSFARRRAVPLVIGFKLTAGASAADRAAAVARLFATGTVDAAIQNDVAGLAAGVARPFRAYVPGRVRPEQLAGLPALAAWLDKFISGRPPV